MTDERTRVTLTKGQCVTAPGRELVGLLTGLSADGEVTREEMAELRGWLEVDHGVDFAALPFLHEVIEQISADGEVTDDELDRVAAAIERVLPKDLREAASQARRASRAAGRQRQREALRTQVLTARSKKAASREAARHRAGILHSSEFAVRGAFRSEDRRTACGRLVEGDEVTLERERNNRHDSNAILVLVLGVDDCELGYVPLEKAALIAPLLDSGAAAETTVARIWETPDEQLVPILRVKVRRGDSAPETPTRAAPGGTGRPGCGCVGAAMLLVMAIGAVVMAFDR